MRITSKFIFYVGGAAALITAAGLCLFYYNFESVILQVDRQTHLEDQVYFKKLLVQLSSLESGIVSSRLEQEMQLLKTAASILSTPRQPEETRRILSQVLERSPSAIGLFLKSYGTEAQNPPRLELCLFKASTPAQKPVFKPYSEFPSWTDPSEEESACFAATLPNAKLEGDGPAFVLVQRIRNAEGIEQGMIGFLFSTDFLAGIFPRVRESGKEHTRNQAALSSGNGQFLAIAADTPALLNAKLPSPAQILASGGCPISTNQNAPLICENIDRKAGEYYKASTLTPLPVISTEKTSWFYQRHWTLPAKAGFQDPPVCAAQGRVKSFFAVIFVIAVFALILFIIELAYVSKLIVMPLKQAVAFSNDLSKGNFNTLPLKISSGDEIGELIRSLNFMRDRLQNLITKLKSSHEREKSARHEAEAANHMKSDFLANMSLELRNPLNSIMGFSSLILKDAEKGNHDDELKRKAKTIFTSAETLNRLITNLLELSRIDAIEMELSPVEIHTAEFMREIIDCNNLAASEKGVSLENHFSAEAPGTIRIDRDLLFHVLSEITAALIKTAAPGATVSLGCRQTPDEKLVFRLWDSKSNRGGESLAELYNRYSNAQGEELFPSLHGAAMLSLAIAKSNAHILGADFKSAKTEDADSCFELSISLADLLPIAPSEETSAIHSATNWDDSKKFRRSILAQRRKGKNKGPHTLSVLLAEDNTENRLLIEMMLANSPYKLDCVSDGVACLEAMAAQKYDLLLLDLQMPKLDGFGVIEKLRADENYNEIPIIVLTAYIEEGDKEKLRSAGANECLLKPLNIDELLAAIRSLT